MCLPNHVPVCLPMRLCLPNHPPNTACPYIFRGRRFIFRADTQVRPYVNHDEMNMIGHANECITLDIRKFVFQFRIPSENHCSRIIQPHPAIHDFPEQTPPILDADGDEIRPGLRIIGIPQSNATPTMNGRIIFHARPPKIWSADARPPVGADLCVCPIMSPYVCPCACFCPIIRPTPHVRTFSGDAGPFSGRTRRSAPTGCEKQSFPLEFAMLCQNIAHLRLLKDAVSGTRHGSCFQFRDALAQVVGHPAETPHPALA